MAQHNTTQSGQIIELFNSRKTMIDLLDYWREKVKIQNFLDR